MLTERYKKTLQKISARTWAGEKVGITVRELLRLFGKKKRGPHVQDCIEMELLKLRLGTEPSFRLPTKYESTVWFVPRLTRVEVADILQEEILDV